jgi:hypothetical protein
MSAESRSIRSTGLGGSLQNDTILSLGGSVVLEIVMLKRTLG